MGKVAQTERCSDHNGWMSDEHEPPDLDELDVDEQHREVYAWAGLALYMAQVVEHGLVNVLFLARLSDPKLPLDYATADDFFEVHFRQVMGRLVTAIRTHVGAPADLDSMLDSALRLRNFIVHQFFRERIELFCHQEGRQLMLDELVDAVRQLRALDRRLDDLVLHLGAPYGITADRIAEEVDGIQGHR